jgi:ABC-2 type transport system permease protein
MTRKTAAFLRVEVVRMVRDPKYLALAVIAPIGFYLLFATLFGGAPTRPGELPGTVQIMVAMAAYGAIWAVLSTTGPRISEERQIGWLTQVRAMPLPAAALIVSKIVATILTALPAILLVCTTAVVVKGVSLSPGQWGGLIVAMWSGSAAFAMLGVAIGFTLGADAAYPASYGLYMALSALGGLWVPPAVLPAGMRDIAGWLPTYHLADLGWRIAGGSLPTLASVGNLAAWTVIFGCLAAISYRAPSWRTRAGRSPGNRAGAATAAQ